MKSLGQRWTGPEGTQEVTRSSPTIDSGVEAREGQARPYSDCGVVGGRGRALAEEGAEAPAPGPTWGRDSFPPSATKSLKAEVRMNRSLLPTPPMALTTQRNRDNINTDEAQ